eukprot:TRINITY_DN8226_c0_g2_i1.p4 TRINITY_DN8226_c0_g2~~TRINITY_DN8226_c0_g2_i1.p4  ORF type:complete len:133 (+),score=16.38 TRINITY_DN8226_c0_g2_i1:384-782(+)
MRRWRYDASGQQYIPFYISQNLLRRQSSYLNGMSEETFACDSLVQDAVIRNYEIIGEAAKNIPGNFRILHPGIDWSGMAGLRDILIHQYFGVDLISIWNISQKQAPDTLKKIQALPEYKTAKNIIDKKSKQN